MTKEEMVYEYLCDYHIGKENLIKNRSLREKFNIHSDKAMREVIQNIREDENFNKVVGSISGRTGGFYICDTRDEVSETIDNIRHRAKEMLKMCDVLRKKSRCRRFYERR